MATQERYRKCLNEMFALRRFGIKLGLSTIRNILKGLGNPERRFQSVHVAGTNGKGSIASALASILHGSGYKVGLYTSPHLVRFNERIQVNLLPVTDKKVVELYRSVKRRYQGRREPTFFEYTTAMAFYEFARRGVDWAVVETGMGGRLDATNILSPALSIISNVSLEHQAYLGSTIAQIAREKGGIIKEKTPVVTGVTQAKAIAVLEEIAARKKAPIYRLGRSFRTRRTAGGSFTYRGIDETWRDLRVGLNGKHQVLNAALVLAACEILNRRKVGLQIEGVKTGLLNNVWPGRLEVVSTRPLVILDGAHNRIAAHTLAQYIREHLKNKKVTLVIGILDDKPYAAMLKSLLPVCSRAIITRPKIDRATDPARLFAIAQKIIGDVTVIGDVEAAVAHALNTVSAQDAVCIAGSLYVVGEAKEALGKKDTPVRRTPAGESAWGL